MAASGRGRGFSLALSVSGYPENIRTKTCFSHYLHDSLHLLCISWHIAQTTLDSGCSGTWEMKPNGFYEGLMEWYGSVGSERSASMGLYKKNGYDCG